MTNDEIEKLEKKYGVALDSATFEDLRRVLAALREARGLPPREIAQCGPGDEAPETDAQARLRYYHPRRAYSAPVITDVIEQGATLADLVDPRAQVP